MAPDTNVAELLVRLVASLGMVVAIILVAHKYLRTKGGLRFGRGPNAPKLDVLDRAPIGRNAQVAVVRVGGRGLIVGVTEQSVTLLAEAPELIDRYETEEAERTAPPAEQGTRRASAWRGLGRQDVADAPEPARMNIFEALREATVRRS
jgi:flagellar biosynthetic protein FliO